ncbi:MAG: hypothetical protein AABY27_07295 [Pseudomonadota bacterium]
MNKRSSLLIFVVSLLICLQLSNTCFSIAQKTINYTITPHYNDKNNYITICLEFNGDKNGITKLFMPKISTIEGININFKSDVGDIVVVDENKSIKINNKSVNFITLKHTPNTKIKITYQIDASSILYFGQDQDILFSGNILIFLEALNHDKEEHFKINFNGLKDAKKYVITSKKIINSEDAHFIVLEDAMKSWYYFGNKDVTKNHVDHLTNYTFIKIGERPKKNFTNVVNKILASCENFIIEVSGKIFMDNIQKTIIIMDGMPDPFSGTYADDMYVVIYNKGDSLGKFTNSLAHELLHYLFGDNLKVSFGPDEKYLSYWFDEGFTYYYSSLLNYESGIITLQEYLEIMNAQIKEYYQTYAPLRTFINEMYACTGNKAQLNSAISSYLMQSLHGSLFANNLDNLLKIKSNNKYSLKDLLKVLTSSCKLSKCYISKIQFLESIEKLFISKNKIRWFENFINMHIVDYKPIFLVSPILAGKAKLDHQCCDETFDVGFNVVQTMCSGVVFGIKDDSNAYKLGLRNGNKLTSLDITPERVSLVIDDYDEISYKPMIKSVIPRYRSCRP